MERGWEFMVGGEGGLRINSKRLLRQVRGISKVDGVVGQRRSHLALDQLCALPRGDPPTTCLKARLNCESDLKPTANAIALLRRFGFCRRLRAFSTRARATHSTKLMPVASLNFNGRFVGSRSIPEHRCRHPAYGRCHLRRRAAGREQNVPDAVAVFPQVLAPCGVCEIRSGVHYNCLRLEALGDSVPKQQEEGEEQSCRRPAKRPGIVRRKPLCAFIAHGGSNKVRLRMSSCRSGGRAPDRRGTAKTPSGLTAWFMLR